MKRLALTIALLACLPVFAQDQTRSVPRNDTTIYRIGGTYRVVGFENQLIITSTNLEWIDHNTGLIRLTGKVEIRTKGTVLTADEADYHMGTGEIEPRGNVRLMPFAQ
jgi:lipopolysaccharide assembly outer membrane protein LptD (OstA)